MRYVNKIIHVPGKCLYTVDALSRAPLKEDIGAVTQFEEEIEMYVHHIKGSVQITYSKLEQITQYQQYDEVCRQLIIIYSKTCIGGHLYMKTTCLSWSGGKIPSRSFSITLTLHIMVTYL
jgi:hypothetical protein